MTRRLTAAVLAVAGLLTLAVPPAAAKPRHRRALRDVQRVAQPRQRPAICWPTCRTRARDTVAGTPGAQRRRGDPARRGPTSCWSTSSTSTRTGKRRGCSATTSSRSRRTAPGRPSTRTSSSRRRTPASRRASTSTTAAGCPTRPPGWRRRLRLRRSSPASSAWSCTRSTRSTTAARARSSTSSGRTCRARGCRDDPATAAPRDWYSPEELNVFRLSSKSHWDVPIRIGRKTVHFLTSHPTPPVFDGPEDRNGTRNADEIRLFADYVTPGRGALHLRRRGQARRPEARLAVRDRGRPELRSARRRQHPGRDPAAARQPADQRRQRAEQRGRRRGDARSRAGRT